VGVFAQANFGAPEELTVLGIPAGQHLTAHKLRGKDKGSVIVATDAPLQPHQLKRLARRVPIGLARTGAVGSNSSGDIFLAFSTANESAYEPGPTKLRHAAFLRNDAIDPIFKAVVQATEEAVLDSMFCACTMVGRDGNTSVALPVDKLLALMKA